MSLIHLLESRQLFAISLTPTPALPAPDPIFGEEFTAPFYLRADHVLRVNGSAGDDAIAFSRNAAGWVAELNGVSRMYAPADVTGFRAYGNTGNDSIEVSGGVWLATTLDGGDGHDTVSGGSGPDTIYGQGGNDTLRGNIGNDKLFGGYGMDTLTGQAGADEFRGGDDYDTVSYDDDVLRLGGVTVYFNGLTD